MRTTEPCYPFDAQGLESPLPIQNLTVPTLAPQFFTRSLKNHQPLHLTFLFQEVGLKVPFPINSQSHRMLG